MPYVSFPKMYDTDQASPTKDDSIYYITPWHSDKKSKNQTGNSAAMFIKPKNHKIDLILP